MPFQKMTKPQYPPRHWALVSYPGDGKSTFATQMRTPLLPIDADHRFSEVVNLVEGDVYELSNDPADSASPETIHKLLGENMPDSGVKTIVVDSLTAIITPKVVEAVIESDARRERNRQKKVEGRKDLENLTTPFKDKALTMRLLQDAITRWGTDVLWIYHLQDSRDENAKEVIRHTLSATERARLYRSLNVELHIVKSADEKRRGVKVVWARRGRSGMTLWDDSGKWTGMPEKIEAAVYGGLSQAEQDQIEQAGPDTFVNDEAAIEWAMEQGVFGALQHAKNAYSEVKEKYAGEVARRGQAAPAELSRLWRRDVGARRAKRGFETLEDLLYQLHLDFGLSESEAKGKLKERNYTGFPANGDKAKKSTEMYFAVKALMESP
jgi:hypothetical protein